MLPSGSRLRDPDLFRSASRRGRHAAGPLLVLHLERRTSDEQSLVGLVVSKAVGKAVTRNLVKRRLRHLLRDRLQELPAGSVLVVRARPQAATASYAELGSAVDTALTKVLAQVAAR